jgi:hypothetical protein
MAGVRISHLCNGPYLQQLMGMIVVIEKYAAGNSRKYLNALGSCEHYRIMFQLDTLITGTSVSCS